jgi:hypothetical protein
MQDLSTPAKIVIGNTLNGSGTPERAMMSTLLVGGGAGYISPHLLIPPAVLAGLYTRPAQAHPAPSDRGWSRTTPGDCRSYPRRRPARHPSRRGERSGPPYGGQHPSVSEGRLMIMTDASVMTRSTPMTMVRLFL